MVMPVYQKAGIQLAPIPQMTTVGIQEAARTSEVLSKQLDRLSNFAFRQAEVEAKVTGREYGALNAPSAQQLKDAIARGEDPAKQVPGDKTTVFGQTAREAALSSLTTSMEIEARKSVTEIQTAYEKGEITLDDMGTRLQLLASSQSEILRSIDPLAAQQFSASIGLSSNSAYLAAAKQEAVAAKKDLEIRYRAGVDNFIRSAETAVRAGPQVNEETKEVITVDQIIEASRAKILEYAMQIDDPSFSKQAIADLDKAVSDAKIGVVMDEAMLKPGVALNILKGGTEKFEDKEVQATFDILTNQERRTLFGELNAALSNKFSLESQADAAREKQRIKESDQLQANFTVAFLNGEREEMESILLELKEKDPTAWASKSEVAATEAGIDKPQVVRKLEVLSLRNELTQGKVDSAFNDGDLSIASYKTYMSHIKAQENQGYTKAITFLKGARGLPDQPLFNAAGVNRIAQQEVAKIQNELIDAMDKDPSIDALQFVRDKIRDLEGGGDDLANDSLRRSAEQLGDELRTISSLQNLSAQELLDAITNNPGLYPNEARRTQAIDKLLPLLIRIEAQQ